MTAHEPSRQLRLAAPPRRRIAPGGDLVETQLGEITRNHLAAVVESSDDAIISKTLDGVITSWNRGAERLFGYSADEAIGQPITMVIPPELANEEPEILKRLRQGERIDHYETVRMRKDGTRLDISLSVSPIRNAHGTIVGAAKIARDISLQKRVERENQEQARALAAGFNHHFTKPVEPERLLALLKTERSP